MKILSLALIAIVLTSSIGQAQAAQAPAELTKYTDQQRWNRAARFSVVWATVAISLGKSKGMKIEEIGEWLGRQYAPGWSATMTAKGLVDGFHRNMMSAPDAIFEITSNSDGVITWRTNRPYLAIFGDSRTLYGVTVEEYEQVMVLIDRAIAQRANLELTEKVEGAWWVSTVRPDPVTEALRAGQQLMRDGKADEALASYLRVTEQFPASAAARIGVGVHLDLMGRYAEARTHFTKALGMDLTPALEAQALRSMAMAYAFESNCKDAIPFEQRLYERYLTKDRDSNMAGEIANELARVCLESGDFDTAAAWYKRGYDAGLQEPTTSAARKDLSQFRWHHAQARIAIRKGNKPEAEKQVAAAKAVLDKGTNPDQAPFYPYLVGYVAFYAGDYKAALAEFQKGNQNDPFILNLIAQSHEKLGDQAAAMAHYRKVMGFTTHNPANAFARPFARKKLGL